MSEAPAARRLFIKSYGCQMNVYDGERMAELLSPHGWRVTDRPEEADLVVLNTCHIRERATEKVYSELGRLKALREEPGAGREGMLIAVAGCVAQAEGAEIAKRQSAVDIVVGPQSYHRLPELIATAGGRGKAAMAVEFETEAKFDALPRGRTVEGVSAFLTIQEGCDKFCTFCVVPYTRGAEISRPATDVEAEARSLVDAGAREITLLGQNVNAYDGIEGGLGALVRRLARIDGLLRIRYTTSHPSNLDDGLIRAHAEVEKLMPYLHLPVQSGSDRVLKAMNRLHDRSDYLRLVERLRAARPDLALSTDIIVGFPGESEADFEATLELVRAVGFASAFSFKYSRRPGTPAAALGGQVPEEVKAERLARLNGLLEAQQRAFNASMVGRLLPVLAERLGRHPGQVIGRSPYLQAVHFEAPTSAIGRIREVEIVSAAHMSLGGALVLEAA